MREIARTVLLGGWLLGAIIMFHENQFSPDSLLLSSEVLFGGLVMLGAAVGFLVLALHSYFESRRQSVERTHKFFEKYCSAICRLTTQDNTAMIRR